MSDHEKICILCGKSCAGQARIKNGKGQYAHQACAEAKQASKEKTPSPIESGSLYEEDAYNDALGGGMDDLLGDLSVQEEPAGSSVACPGCGHRMNEGVVVCMSCGFNTASGKGISTKTKEVKTGPGVGGAALGGVAAVSTVAAAPMLPLIGALIGGAIGAAVWAAFAYFTGYELGFLAIGVGVLCGVGATLGGGAQTTGGSMIAGVMAAAVAVGSIGVGKYVAIDLTFDRIIKEDVLGNLSVDDIGEAEALDALATGLCYERIDSGGVLAWDDPFLFVNAAEWPGDYPFEIREMVIDEWESLNDGDRINLRRDIADEGWGLTYHDIDEKWVLSSLANKEATRRAERGQTIDWPDPNLPIEFAYWPEDYPVDIQEQAIAKWDAMDADARDAYREDVHEQLRVAIKEFGKGSKELIKSSVIDSYKHPRQIVFIVLAVMAAYGIGSND